MSGATIGREFGRIGPESFVAAHNRMI